MWLFLILCITFIGCNNGIEPKDDSPKVTLQGYLVINEAVSKVQLTYPLDFLSSDTVCLPVTDAEVTLHVDNNTITLTSPNKDGFYSSEVIVGEDKTYEIKAHVKGYKTISAKTTTPMKWNAKLESDKIAINHREVSYREAMNAIASGIPHPNIDLNLEKHTARDHYFIIFRCLESQPRRIWRNAPGQQGGPGNRGMSTDVFNNGEFEINFRYLRFFGKHMGIVYKITDDYAVYYNTIKKANDHNVNTFLEPTGNVANGLGIFTGLALDTINFEVDSLSL